MNLNVMDKNDIRKTASQAGITGALALPCSIEGRGYECPNCGGLFPNLRAYGGRKRPKTLPRHLVVVMTSEGIKPGSILCDGWGEFPVNEQPGFYPAAILTWHALRAELEHANGNGFHSG